MPASGVWELFGETLFAAGVVHTLPLLLAAWLVLRRLPPVRRPAFAMPVGLYGLAILGLLAAAIVQQFALPRTHAVLYQLAVLLVGVACIRVAGQVVFRALLPALGIRPPSLLEDLVAVTAYVAWAMLRLSQNGLDPSSIVTTSAVITAIVAFSLQETLSNVFGGAALQLEDAIHLGDWLKLDDVIGRVVDIGWHSTLVETRNWETVVIPNAVLLRSKFAILGRRTGAPVQWRRWVWFAAPYAVAPQRVIAVVEDALRRADIPNVAAGPPPNCVAMEFADSAVRYAVRYWLTDLAVDDPTDSAVRAHIHAAFRRAGIQFPFPESTLHLVREGEREQARSHHRDVEQRMQALRSVEIFSSLRDNERAQLADHMVPAPFLAGETVTRQGDVAHWLYVLVGGEAKVVYEAEGGERGIGTLRAGTPDSFFGEIGMLTGSPRTSSVIAVTDVECYRIDKQGFELVLRERPAIAEEISTIMAQRRTGLAAAQDALGQEAHRRMLEDDRGELLTRIRRFFGLDGGAARPDRAA